MPPPKKRAVTNTRRHACRQAGWGQYTEEGVSSTTAQRSNAAKRNRVAAAKQREKAKAGKTDLLLFEVVKGIVAGHGCSDGRAARFDAAEQARHRRLFVAVPGGIKKGSSSGSGPSFCEWRAFSSSPPTRDGPADKDGVAFAGDVGLGDLLQKLQRARVLLEVGG